MSADEYLCTFVSQMEAVVYTCIYHDVLRENVVLLFYSIACLPAYYTVG